MHRIHVRHHACVIAGMPIPVPDSRTEHRAPTFLTEVLPTDENIRDDQRSGDVAE
jgi:hypothetical protein